MNKHKIYFGPEPGALAAFETFWRSLLVVNWNADSGPIRFGTDFTLADLVGAPFFANARALLATLVAEGGENATETGNLSRAFVAGIFDRLALPELRRESIRTVCKVLNEQDVWDLHVARVVSECAGLVVRRKKRFQATKVGRALLVDDQAGCLYRRLFVAYFRKFDLHYDFHLRHVPGIQETMAVILWRLDIVARDWTRVRGLAPQILLPGVLDQMHRAMINPHDKEEWVLGGYVLDPLFDLGLIERKKRSEWPGISEDDEIRASPLWRKFISIEYPSQTAQSFQGN